MSQSECIFYYHYPVEKHYRVGISNSTYNKFKQMMGYNLDESIVAYYTFILLEEKPKVFKETKISILVEQSILDSLSSMSQYYADKSDGKKSDQSSKTKYYLLPKSIAEEAVKTDFAEATEYGEEEVYDHVEWDNIVDYEGVYPSDRGRYRRVYKKKPYRVSGDEPEVAVSSSLFIDEFYYRLWIHLVEERNKGRDGRIIMYDKAPIPRQDFD